MVDLNKVVANINLDMYLPLFPLLKKSVREHAEIGDSRDGVDPEIVDREGRGPLEVIHRNSSKKMEC